MLIGIDIDEVKVDFLNTFLKHYNEHNGTNVTYNDVKHHDYVRFIGDRDAVKQALNAFYASEQFRDMESFPDAKTIIPVLAKQHKLLVISARPEHVHDHTRGWLERHFPGCFIDVRFSSRGGIRKAQLCKEFGVDVFIEDNSEYATEVANMGIRVLLFDRPWNQYPVPSNVIRVNGWEEVLTILNT